MNKQELTLADNRFEVLARGDEFVGLGKVWIGEILVRSGRLPLRAHFQSFSGWELSTLLLREVRENENEIRIRTEAVFRPLETKLMRDHSFDPIHETGDWSEEDSRSGMLELVIRPARDSFNGVEFGGFDYHYEYSSSDVPLFHIMDKASWELDGDIEGATAVSQSSCSAPVAHFAADSAWTTEGVIHGEDPNSKANPVMTHNLPRWASHGSFDFQSKNDRTLIGVFERVELIRSVLQRDAGKAELKTFDKHIFDQALEYSTSPKKILLNRDAKTVTQQQNLWTWVFDEVHRRARGEFGLRHEPLVPRIAHNLWRNFTIDDYRRDVLPAAQNLGVKALFVDNLNQSDLTCGFPTPSQGNMCCGHDYRVASELGGEAMLQKFMDDCRASGIAVYAWSNNDQSLASPLNHERDGKNWFVKMEDARLKYGGAYSNVFSIWNFKNDEARKHWIESLKTINTQTGLNGYLFDSFYNLGFMPLDYSDCTPTTQWRELLQAFKELQDADVHFLIESFGPFGQVQHGCPTSYNLENLFACYQIGMGSGYTTIPTGATREQQSAHQAQQMFGILAHGSDPGIPLWIEDRRVDEVWSEAHKRALADYHQNLPQMHTRYLQEDGQGVLWHDEGGTRATLWNFADRFVALRGEIVDLSSNEPLEVSDAYNLQAGSVYSIGGVSPLPVDISSSVLAPA